MNYEKGCVKFVKKNRLGEINHNTYGSKMKIIKYVNALNIFVEFQNGFITHTQYDNFKKGIVKNPYDKTLFSVGYLGEGKYKSSEHKKATKTYTVWMAMIRYCYSKKSLRINKTGEECSVCEEWHNFQNFAKWYDENYYEIEQEKMELDKDILYKGNKIYSPKTCIFVPKIINNIFKKRENFRGKYPIGVTREGSRYRIDIDYIDFKNKKTYKRYLGHCETLKKSFDIYKKEKENYIKNCADYYKNDIPQNLYDVMYRYEVEISD